MILISYMIWSCRFLVGTWWIHRLLILWRTSCGWTINVSYWPVGVCFLRSPEMLTVEFGAFPMRVAVGNVSIVPRRQGVSDRCKNMETQLFSFVDGIDGHGFYTILGSHQVCMLPCWSCHREVPVFFWYPIIVNVLFQHKWCNDASWIWAYDIQKADTDGLWNAPN